MSLRYVKRNTFTAEVAVVLAGGEKGSFTAEYNYFDRDKLDELIKQELTDVELLEKILCKVSKIKGEDDKELPPDDQYELVKSDLALSAAATRVFLEKIGGAQKGNSQQSRGR